ncbi:MAG: STN domain-containing protein, partial [Chitinophagaceae bacterium]
MKLFFSFLILFGIHANANMNAQTVSLSGKNLPIENVLSSIKAQTGFLFFYDYEIVQKAKPISIDVKNIPLTEALNLICKDQQFTYQLENKTIVLKEKEIIRKAIEPAETNQTENFYLKGYVYG